MRFTKMHGIGNDYVYVDCFSQPMPTDPAALSQIVSDRHFGIGSDGLILICPSDKADARMRMFNADGSESEMCGNGIRCVAKFVHDHGIARKLRLTIETGGGVRTLDLEIRDGKAVRVKVDMGEPILEPDRIPAKFPTAFGSKLTVGGKEFTVNCVSMGNPHCVVFEDDQTGNLLTAESGNDPMTKFGSLIENDPHFPRRVNMHFVRVHNRSEVTMRTWERGSGITLACGTGACAVCVAAAATGRTDRKVLAHLPGGDLELEWSEGDRHVYMTGSATEVFSGEWLAPRAS